MQKNMFKSGDRWQVSFVIVLKVNPK
jgi:hypothetical protein